MKLTDILIVDDHPMTVDSYVSLLQLDATFENCTFTKAYSCGEAFQKIKFIKASNKRIQFAILDINLPPFEEAHIFNGIDLARVIRKEFPMCKLLFLTMRTEPVLVDQVIKMINPEGFISKNDSNHETFSLFCNEIRKGFFVKSTAIQQAMGTLLKENIYWDSHDSQIVLLLSEGVKTIELQEYIPLSMSAIEKRKASIKLQLLKGKGSDKELVNTAKSLGLI